MDETRTLPCPQCGGLQRRYVEDVCPGAVFPCHACRCHLVLTAELTFAHASDADLEQRSIGEQEVGRLMERMWSGRPQDVYC